MSHAAHIMDMYTAQSDKSRKRFADAFGHSLTNTVAETPPSYDSSNPADMSHAFAAKVARWVYLTLYVATHEHDPSSALNSAYKALYKNALVCGRAIKMDWDKKCNAAHNQTFLEHLIENRGLFSTPKDPYADATEAIDATKQRATSLLNANLQLVTTLAEQHPREALTLFEKHQADLMKPVIIQVLSGIFDPIAFHAHLVELCATTEPAPKKQGGTPPAPRPELL